MNGERALIERAMAGVAVVPCGRCQGEGQIGAPTLRIACPVCRGCCVTTITTQLEVGGGED
jgi:hypothetical protein